MSKHFSKHRSGPSRALANRQDKFGALLFPVGPTRSEADGTLGYRGVVRLQGGDGRRDGRDPEGHVRVARVLLGNIHQHIRSRITRIGVEDQVELHAIFVADNRHGIVVRSVQETEPQCPIEFERTIEIAHSDADVIDPLDRDRWLMGISFKRVSSWTTLFRSTDALLSPRHWVIAELAA
jgi:hypothetical protein